MTDNYGNTIQAIFSGSWGTSNIVQVTSCLANDGKTCAIANSLPSGESHWTVLDTSVGSSIAGIVTVGVKGGTLNRPIEGACVRMDTVVANGPVGNKGYANVQRGGYDGYQSTASVNTGPDGAWQFTNVPVGSYTFFIQVGSCTDGNGGALAVAPAGQYSDQYYNGLDGTQYSNFVPVTSPGPTTGTIYEQDATRVVITGNNQTESGVSAALSAGGAIQGRITDSSGHGIQVCIRVDTAYNTNPVPPSAAQNATDVIAFGYSIPSDSNGNYTAGGLPAGDYYISVSNLHCGITTEHNYNPGYYFESDPTNFDQNNLSPIQVNNGGTTTGINMNLGVAGSISGTIKDYTGDDSSHSTLNQVCAEVGKIVNGQFMNLFNARAISGPDPQNNLPDVPNGTYTITGVPAGTYVVFFSTLGCGSGGISPQNTSNDNHVTGAEQFYDGGANTDSTGQSTVLGTPTPVVVTAGADTPEINADIQSGTGNIKGKVTDAALTEPKNLVNKICVLATDTLGSNPLQYMVQTDSSGNYDFGAFNLPSDVNNLFTIEVLASCGNGRGNGYYSNYDYGDRYATTDLSHGVVASLNNTQHPTSNMLFQPSNVLTNVNLDEVEMGSVSGNVVASDRQSAVDGACLTLTGSDGITSYSTTTSYGSYYFGGVQPLHDYTIAVVNCASPSGAPLYSASVGALDRSIGADVFAVSPETPSWNGNLLNSIVLPDATGTGDISGTLYDSGQYFEPIVGTLPGADISIIAKNDFNASQLPLESFTVVTDLGSSFGMLSPGEFVQLIDGSSNVILAAVTETSGTSTKTVSLNVVAYQGDNSITSSDTVWTIAPLSMLNNVCVTAVAANGNSYSTTTNQFGVYTLFGLNNGSYNVIFGASSNCDGSSDYYPVTYYNGFAKNVSNVGGFVYAPPSNGATTNYSISQKVTVGGTSSAQTCQSTSEYCAGVVENVNGVLSAQGSLIGVVTDSSGNPVAGVCVTAFSADGNYMNLSTNSDGSWRINSVPASAYTIKFNSVECGAPLNYNQPFYSGVSSGSATQNGSALVYVTSGQVVTGINVTLSTAPSAPTPPGNPAPDASPSVSALIPINGSLVDGARLTWTPVTYGGSGGAVVAKYLVKTYDASNVCIGTQSPCVPVENVLQGQQGQQGLQPLSTLSVASTCNFACTMDIFGLAPGRTYVFTVQAVNDFNIPGGAVLSNLVLTVGAPILNATAAVAQNGTASAPGLNTGGASSVSATASGGVGSIALASYSTNPVTGSSGLTNPSTYFDVGTSAGATFTGSTFQVCGLATGQAVYWFNPATQAYVQASNQTPESAGCSTVTVSSTTTPSTQQLYGTVFATATVPVVTPPSGGGGGGYVAPVQPTVTVPAGPGNAAAIVSGTSVTITWTAPVATSTSSPVTGYVVSAQGTLTPITCTTTTALMCTISGLAAAPYTFSVVATSATGNSSAAQTSTVTIAAPTTGTGTGTGTTGSGTTGSGGTTPVTPVSNPVTKGAPAALSIKATSSVTGAVSIVLTKSPVPGKKAIASYQYSTGAGVWKTVYAVHGAFTIKGLKSGKTYAVQLRAVSAVGAGTPSKPYNVKIK